MAVDDPALQHLRDDLVAAISAAIRESEHRFTEAISAAEARLGARIEASAAEARLDISAAEKLATRGPDRGLGGRSAARMTSAAEARLGARIEAAAAEARLDISAAETRLGVRIEASAAEARLDTSAAEARLGARIEVAAAEARLELRRPKDDRARIEASAAETRRHMGVVAEGLRSNIALVAEGVVTLTERLGAEMREGVEIIDRRLLRVEARLLATGPASPPHI